jgi:competence ComEA-like helix-hairpin-helix protein
MTNQLQEENNKMSQNSAEGETRRFPYYFIVSLIFFIFSIVLYTAVFLKESKIKVESVAMIPGQAMASVDYDKDSTLTIVGDPLGSSVNASPGASGFITGGWDESSKSPGPKPSLSPGKIVTSPTPRKTKPQGIKTNKPKNVKKGNPGQIRTPGTDFSGRAGNTSDQKPSATPCFDNPPKYKVANPPKKQLQKLININTASADVLDTLPGIGPKKALEIVKYRLEFGPFKTTHEIVNVKGIGEKIFERIKDKITI